MTTILAHTSVEMLNPGLKVAACFVVFLYTAWYKKSNQGAGQNRVRTGAYRAMQTLDGWPLVYLRAALIL